MARKVIICKKCNEEKELHAKDLCFKCYKQGWKAEKIVCKSCGRLRPHQAFGLCGGCHSRLHHYDKIKRYNAKKYHNIDLDTLIEFTKSCVSCGFTKIVELHHLDGNTKNNTANNLVGLCPNCHRMIHNYKFFKEIVNNLKKKSYPTENIHPSNYVHHRK